MKPNPIGRLVIVSTRVAPLLCMNDPFSKTPSDWVLLQQHRIGLVIELRDPYFKVLMATRVGWMLASDAEIVT